MRRAHYTTLLTLLCFALCPASAGARRAKLLTSGPLVVSPDGSVKLKGAPLGKLPLPPKATKVSFKQLTVSGQALVHVTVQGAGDRRAELLVKKGASGEPIFAGLTGPQGVDGEWRRALHVTDSSVLRYQTRNDALRCDGAPVYLFPRMYDFKAGRFRPVAHVPKAAGLAEIVATRKAPEGASGEPLNTFRLVFASTQLGDEQRAINLAAPSAAEDGDPKTVWAEGLGGAGQGELLTARALPSPYKLRALRIVPGHAADAKAFRAANRIKSALLLLSASKRYRITFPKDPARERGDPALPYWVVLPEPVATVCATLIIESVYPGDLARKQKDGGRTAIAELRFFTGLEFSGGLPRVLEDLDSPVRLRGDNAVRILTSMGKQGVKLVAARITAQASPRLLARILAVLARHRVPEAAAPLAQLLPRLEAKRHREAALEALGRLGDDAVNALTPLLAGGDPPEQRAEVAQVLGRLGGDSARTALLAAAGKDPVVLRAGVVAGLASLSRPEDLEAVISAAEAAKPPLRADMVLAAGKLADRREAPAGGKAAAGRIAALWPGATEFEERYRIVNALGRLDAVGQLPTLLKVLGGDEPVLRWIALEQIRRVDDHRARAALVKALQDRDPRARTTAALGLVRQKANAAISRTLAKRMGVEHWPMAATAVAEALGHHCSPVGTKALKSAVWKAPRGVDTRALISMAQCNPPDLATYLLEMAKDTGWRAALRLRALTLLQPRLTARNVDGLLELFKELRGRAAPGSDDEAVASALTGKLARLRDKRAPEAVVDALVNDPRETIRAAAARALGRGCIRGAKAPLKRALKDPSKTVRRVAKQVVKRCRF
jgi:HEAT repeat protein